MCEYKLTFSYYNPDSKNICYTSITVAAWNEDHARQLAGDWFRRYYRELTLT